jgi:hypothetical protein
MKVKVEDLQVGDEIIISNWSDLRYLKIVKAPKLTGALHYHTKAPLYGAAKCLVHSEPATYYNGHVYNKKVFSDKDLNTIVYKDLYGRDIWLVKRNDEFIFD